MYMSVLDIYKGKANCVTDSYQIELFNEWLSFLRVDRFKSISSNATYASTHSTSIFNTSSINSFMQKLIALMAIFLLSNFRHARQSLQLEKHAAQS